MWNIVRMTLNCSIWYLIFGAWGWLFCLLFDCNWQRLLLLFRVLSLLLLFLLYNTLGWNWFNWYWLMFDFWLDYLLREMLRVWWRQSLVSYVGLRRRCEYRLITIVKHLAVLLLLFLEVNFCGHVRHRCARYAYTFHSTHHWLHDDMLLRVLMLWMLRGYCTRDHVLRRHYHLDSFFMLVECVPNFYNITLVLFHWFVWQQDFPVAIEVFPLARYRTWLTLIDDDIFVF